MLVSPRNPRVNPITELKKLPSFLFDLNTNTYHTADPNSMQDIGHKCIVDIWTSSNSRFIPSFHQSASLCSTFGSRLVCSHFIQRLNFKPTVGFVGDLIFLLDVMMGALSQRSCCYCVRRRQTCFEKLWKTRA